MDYSLGTLCGIGGCLLLITGMVSPLYSLQFMGMITYPVTAVTEPVTILGFAGLLAAAAWSISVKRHLITILSGMLTFVVTLLTYVVLEQQMADLVRWIGAFSNFSSPFNTHVGSLITITAVVPSWGWYVLIAAGAVLIIAGICSIVQDRRRACFAEDLFE